jgi:hypothetical protein
VSVGRGGKRAGDQTRSARLPAERLVLCRGLSKLVRLESVVPQQRLLLVLVVAAPLGGDGTTAASTGRCAEASDLWASVIPAMESLDRWATLPLVALDGFEQWRHRSKLLRPGITPRLLTGYHDRSCRLEELPLP